MENHYLPQVTCRLANRLITYLFFAVTVFLPNLTAAQEIQRSEVIALPDQRKATSVRDQQHLVPGVDPTLVTGTQVRKKSFDPAYLEKISMVLALHRLDNQAGDNPAGTDSIILVKGVDPDLLRIESRPNTTSYPNVNEIEGAEFTTPQRETQPKGLLPVTDSVQLLPGLGSAHWPETWSHKVISGPPPANSDGAVLALPNVESEEKDSLIFLKANNPTLQNDSQSGNMTTLMSNRSPVAFPDVYTTKPGEPLVVSAPGHLANDTDPEGDPISWVSFQFPSNGTVSSAKTDGGFTYTPDPGFAGVDQFIITITDGQGNFTNGLVIILVEQNFGPQAVPDLYTTPQGEPLVISAPGHLANDTDPEGDPLTWVSFGFPANGTVTGATTDGEFTFTPDPGFSGINSFPITISDGQGNFSSGLVIILVEPNFAPTAVPDVYTTPYGEPLIVSAPGHLANDTDPEGDPLTWVSFGLPANGTVTGATTDGAFTYTPDPGFTGTDSFVITITDGKGNFSSGLISLFVEGNYAPSAVPDLYSTQEGQPLIVSGPGHLANDTDPEGDPLTWVSFGLPPNGTVSGASTDGAFTYTPDPGFKGTDSFVITITDGQGNFSTGLITISVQPAAQNELFAVPDSYTTPAGQPLIVAAPGHLANDFDPEGDPISWVSFQFPANGTVSGASTDGAFTYTPDAGFAGTDSFVVTITDGQGNFASGLVVILVEENFAPEAIPDVFTTPQGEPLVVSAPGHLANDFDLEGDPISWVSFQFPANGTVSGASTDGAFTYTPNAGFSGTDSFVITITDGQGNFSNGLISILVKENIAPTAVPDVYTTPQGEPLVVSAPGHLANDFDPEGDPLSWVSFQFPANGTVSGASIDGTFTYTPNAGFFGTDSFVITITDGQGNFSSGIISILVEANLAPTAFPDVYTTPQGEPLIVSAPGHLANDFDPEGDPISWVSFQIPDSGTVSGASTDGAFTYTPDPGFSGIESISITISDGQGNFTNGLIAILVEPNTPPVADAGADLTVVAGLQVMLDGSGSFDLDGDPITYSWTFATADANDPIPPGSNAVLSDSKTAHPSFTTDLSGMYSVQLIVNDGFENSAPDYVVITALTIPEALDQLREAIGVLVDNGVLNKGQNKALVIKIDKSLDLFNNGKFNATLDILADFRQQILDLWLIDHVLTQEQAKDLLAQIDAIISAIMAWHNQTANLQKDIEAASPAEKNSSPAQKQKPAAEFVQLSISPNPFSSSARVVFHLSESTTVRLVVNDIFGREVRILSNAFREAGRHEVRLEAAGLSAGTYLVKLTTGEGYTLFKRAILIR